MTRIYDAVGQEAGIKAAVDRFYQRVLADPELAPYFVGVEMDRLRWHQAALLTAVTGGPKRYDGRDMAAAHSGLGITEEDFGRVVEHLVATLQDLDVDEPTIAAVGEALTPYRAEIVTE